MPAGRVLSVDCVSDKDGAPAWQVITDYAVRDADGLTRCAVWLPRPGPVPAISDQLAWGHSMFGGAWASWSGEKHKRLAYAFDPADPALWTG